MGRVIGRGRFGTAAVLAQLHDRNADPLVGSPERMSVRLPGSLPRDVPFSEAVNSYLANHGAKSAAYLIRENRLLLHRRGGLAFRLPVDEDPPQWFMLAISTFRQRPLHWRVKVVASEVPGKVKYIVTWLRWRHYVS